MRSLPQLIVISCLLALSACAGSCGDLEGDEDPRDGADIGVPQSNKGGDGGMNWNGADGGVEPDTGVDASRSPDTGQGDAGQGEMGQEDIGPASVCGDGLREGSEACDDGNTAEGDYCSADCSSMTGSCGDGTSQTNESCDDGNTDDGDYCSADCVTITGSCGDSTLQSNETCDDGQTNDCSGTHDGGDGACVPTGTCSSGYALDGSGNCVTNNTTGLTTPCSLGSGYTVFKFHYDSGSTSARIDVWDASCSYSFAPNSACNVRDVYPGFGDVGRTSQGYPVLTSSEYLRVRYSVAGLNFTNATLYVQARSYATSSSTNIEAWSPIYGGIAYGPVDNDFVYDWYGIDWSNHLSPSDSPSLTAIQLYAHQGSNSLAVKAVELCVQ